MPATALSPLEGALWCAKRGFRVFPLRASRASLDEQKKPAINDWEGRATTDPDVIYRWNERHPGSNWAVACGPSGLLVVDLDDKKGKLGTAEWQAMCDNAAWKADTLAVRSASGKSWHLYFAGSATTTAGKLASGVDTRSLGGYVVAPGAVFVNSSGEPLGQYVVELDKPVQPAPDWLVSAAGARREQAAPAPEVIPQGKRDATLVSLGGTMRQRGFDYDEIFAALSVANLKRCHPPMEECDIERISRSVCRYEPGRAERDMAAEQLLAEASGKLEGFHSASDIQVSNLPLRDWVVPGRYLRGAMSLTIGPGGASKSSLALLEAVAIALGRKDLAGLPYYQPAKNVLYYNAEDPKEEIERRIAAICQRHEIPIADLSRLRYLSGTAGNPLRLGVCDQSGRFVRNEHAFVDLAKILTEQRTDLLVLDPWAGVHACNENDNVAIDQLSRAVVRLATECGCSLHVVHHSRKLGGATGEGDAEIARGASSLVAAARYAATLKGMSSDDAKELGVSEKARHNYCRRDDAKSNYAPAAEQATWFERESVDLPGVPENAAAQGVGVLVPIDASRICAEESGYRAALATIIPKILAALDTCTITLYELALEIAGDPEDKDAMGGGTAKTIQRRLEAVTAAPITTEDGKEIRVRMSNGKKTVILSGGMF